MSVSFLRIDDRMIHGQTVTRWALEYPCDGLIAVNDKAATTDALKMAYKSASTKKTFVWTYEAWKKKNQKVLDSKDNYFLITKDPIQMKKILVDDGFVPSDVKKVIVGPCNDRPGAVKLGNNQSIIILGIFACLSSMPGMGGTTIGNYTLGRPLVAGLVCGIVLGDIQAGVLVGAAMQVVYIALVTPGGTVSADVRAVSYIGIPLAMLALNSYGLDPASAKGISMATSFGAMVGTIGTVLFYGTATINLVWQHIGWQAVEKGEFKRLYVVDMVLPWISHIICSFLPAVVMCKLGVPVVEAIKTTLPMDGIAMKTLFTVGSLLPCVGIAILLKQVVTKAVDFIPFFFGFTLAASMGLNLVSVTVVAAMFAIIYYNIKMVGIRAKEAALASGGSFDDDDEEDI